MILEDLVLKDSYNFLGQYIAFFSIPRQPTDPKMWQWYNAPKGLSIMLRPHRNNSTMGAYLSITTPGRGVRDPIVENAMDQGTKATKRMLHRYFEHAGWEAQRVLKGMNGAEDFYMSRAAQVKLSKWTHGRALVLGDAAFATFGIGTSLAIESAFILAGELSKIRNSDDLPRAVERYEEVFRPLFAKMEELPPWFPQAAFPQTTLGLRLRDAALWLVSRTNLYKLFQGDSGDEFELPSYDWVDR
jgi:2-polyprenyl-6-methoxyphenol hydroxylase-like FAD-dependent oxidoreductase